jgi:hypothetical protein
VVVALPSAVPSVIEEIEAAEPELPMPVEETIELQVELEPAVAVPLPAPEPQGSTAKAADVHRFEPRARGSTPPAVASTPSPVPAAPPADPGSQFLVEQPPRELERARRQLLDQWASIEGEGLESSSSWGATSGWNRYEPRTSPTPQPRPVPPPEPSAPPVFGGAALERRDPPAPKPMAAPVSLMPAEDLVPIEPVSETVTPASAPHPHSTPPTPPPMAALPPAPAPVPLPPAVLVPLPPAPPPPLPVLAPTVTVTPVGKVSAPKAPPKEVEEQFFSDTEGKGSQPLSIENSMPIRQNRTWALVIIGGLALGIIVGIILTANNTGEVSTVVDSGVRVVSAPVDAGEPEAVDAGEAFVIVPAIVIDAGQELVEARVDAGTALAVAARDAGAIAITVIDAGAKDAGLALAVAVKDAGLSAVDAGMLAAAAKDAGATLVLATKDAGTALAVAPKDAGTTVAAGSDDAALIKLVDDAKAALVGQKYRKAVQLYRDALKLSPEDASLRSGLGVALVMSDVGYKEAIPYLKDAVKDDPANAQAWLALGIALQNLGRDAEAKTPYKEFLKLKPKGAQADEVRAALQAIP